MRPVFIALLGVVALVCGPGVARSHAQGTVGDSGAVLLVLDASGSMNRRGDDGVRLIEGAQDALVRLVEILPEGSIVGLRVHGHRVPSTDKRNGCRDSELLVPPRALDADEMVEAIRSVSPRGFSPLGLSLREGAADLQAVGGGTIVVVSDGEDNCAPPPPCLVAEDLIAEGFRIRVHTVGFFLPDDSAAREQLQCIADATGGTYGEVDSLDLFSAEVERIVRGALPGASYQFHLTIDGSTDPTKAILLPTGPGIDPGRPERTGGSYTGRIAPGETRWYAVEIDEGEDLAVWGLLPDDLGLLPAGAPGGALEIVLEDSEGNDVSVHGPSRPPSRVDVAATGTREGRELSVGSSIAAVSWDELTDDQRDIAEWQGFTVETYEAWRGRTSLGLPDGPLDPGIYFVGLTWDAAFASDAGEESVAVDFLVLIERVDYEALGGEFLEVPGGSSFDDAVALDPTTVGSAAGDSGGVATGRFAVGISPGETLWYEVGLGDDQDVSLRATLLQPPGTQVDSGDSFSVRIFGPTGDEVDDGRDGSLVHLDDEAALIDDSSRWLPRPQAEATSAHPIDVPPTPPVAAGRYRLAIAWDSAEGGRDARVRFEVVVTTRLVEEDDSRHEPASTVAEPPDETVLPSVEPDPTSAPDDSPTEPQPFAEPSAAPGPGDWGVQQILLIVLAVVLAATLVYVRSRR